MKIKKYDQMKLKYNWKIRKKLKRRFEKDEISNNYKKSNEKEKKRGKGNEKKIGEEIKSKYYITSVCHNYHCINM